MEITVKSPHVKYSENYIESSYDYLYTTCERKENKIEVVPVVEHLVLRTCRRVPRLGVMLVGWGGNNGSTFTAAQLANKLSLVWKTKRGLQKPNWFGSLTQASTVHLGGAEHVPLSQLLPSVHPDDLEIDGWDINSMNLAEALDRAQVLEPGLISQLAPKLSKIKPRPSVYDKDFIAANQEPRADNLLSGTKSEQIAEICRNISEFKTGRSLDEVVVLWTANTERFSEILPGVNDTAESLKSAIEKNASEISPSTMFAYAAIKSRCTYINGSPQNTFVPGIVEMAEKSGVFIAGDDFKSGQTKIKSVLVDFLVSAGIKPTSIVSYNHLGNNDGKNLSAPQQFRSKEISKSNVVDDMVNSNRVLYQPGEKPDHVVVIKYVPYVGDSKRALDEYTSEIMMGGTNTIVVHNTCEDSLLAAPIILDLVVLAELCARIEVKRESDEEFSSFRSVLSVLSYLCKAPLVPSGAPVVNALFRQRACIENIMKACIGLPPDSNMSLEHKLECLLDNDESEPTKKKMKLLKNGRY